MTEPMPVQLDEDEVHYCEVHPDRETELRCNRCGRFMCVQCAVQTPIGYRCRECVRQVEDRFFTGGGNDYLLAFAIAAGMSLIGGVIIRVMGNSFLLFIIIIAMVGGGFIAETVTRRTAGKRGRYSAEIATAGVVIGGLIGAVLRTYLAYPEGAAEAVRILEQAGRQVPSEFTRMGYLMDNTLTLGVILFIAIAAFAVYSRMKS